MKNAWRLFLCLLLFASPGVLASPRDVNRTVQLSPQGRIFLETYKGSVHVSTWDSPRVEIRARIEEDSTCGDEDQRVRDTEIRIDSTSDSLRIRSDYDKLRTTFSLLNLFRGDCNSLPFVHYRLTVPRTAPFRLKDYKSEIRISDLHSDLKIDSYKGEMTIVGLDGSLDLETYKGEARVEFTHLGQTRLDTYKGNIQVLMPRNSRFDLDADLSRRGNLNSDFNLNTRVQETRHRQQRIQGSVNGGGTRVYLKTYKGSFRLRQR